MPLFNYKCINCGLIFEKFLHSAPDKEDILCKECGSKCEKLFTVCKNRTVLDADETYKQQIAPDARNTIDKMNKGSDKEFFDVYGDN